MFGLWGVGKASVALEVKVVGVSAELLDIIMVLDYISMRFVSLVFLISHAVFIYSLSYIRSGENSSRLMGIIVVFVSSMSMLILFPSLLGLMIG